MKLLFDNNLSHKLVARINDLFPGSSHVMMVQLDDADDKAIWEFAKEGEFTIITKDSDFNEISLLKGFPPKIIWIRTGNCKIEEIEQIIRNNIIVLGAFNQSKNLGIIEIS